MIPFFWGIFNIVLTLYFLVICFKSVRYVKEKMGLLAAIIFVLGGLSLVAHPGVNALGALQQTTEIVPSSTEATQVQTKDIAVDPTWFSHLELTVFALQSPSNTVQYKATCALEGFVSGRSWQTMQVHITPIHAKTCQYTIAGKMQWTLLGMPLYSQHKVYRGQFTLSGT